jgi:hypothetical protein
MLLVESEVIMRFERQRYAMGGYAKGGDYAEQDDRPRDGAVLQLAASKFVKPEILGPQASKFEATPDPFRTNIERSKYGPKRTAGGEKSKTEGETKLKRAVEKPGKTLKAVAKLEAEEEREETAEQEREEEEA